MCETSIMSLEMLCDIWNACSRNQINENTVCQHILFYIVIIAVLKTIRNHYEIEEIETIKIEMYHRDKKN